MPLSHIAGVDDDFLDLIDQAFLEGQSDGETLLLTGSRDGGSVGAEDGSGATGGAQIYGSPKWPACKSASNTCGQIEPEPALYGMKSSVDILCTVTVPVIP